MKPLLMLLYVYLRLPIMISNKFVSVLRVSDALLHGRKFLVTPPQGYRLGFPHPSIEGCACMWAFSSLTLWPYELSTWGVSNNSPVHVFEPLFSTGQLMDTLRLMARASFDRSKCHSILHELQVTWHNVYIDVVWLYLFIIYNVYTRLAHSTGFRMTFWVILSWSRVT